MKTVKVKWQTDGDLAVIYLVDDLLLYYSSDKDPLFKRNQRINVEEAQASKPYKATKFDDNLPTDAYIDLAFGWSVGAVQVETNRSIGN